MNYKSKFLIVLAILLASLMLVSAASAANADIAVSDISSIDNQGTIDQSLNEFTNNDSSVNALNAIPSDDVSSLNAVDTSLTYSASYTYNETTGLYDATVTIQLARNYSGSYKYPTGTMNITLGDNTYSGTIVKGTSGTNPSKATITIYGLQLGDNVATVKYSGDNNFNSIEESHTFTVTKKDPNVGFSSTSPSSVYQGNTLSVVGIIDSDVGDEVGIYLCIDNGTWKQGTRTSTVVAGNRYITCDFETSDLAVGTHTVTIRYDGYGIYKNDSASKTFNVNAKKDSGLYVNGLNDTYYLDETLSITAVLNNNVDKTTVSFKIDDGEWTNVTVKNYKWIDGSYKAYADFSTGLSGLSVGTHNITVRYNGGSEYAVAEQTLEFTTVLRNPNMSVSEIPDSIALGDNLTVDVTLATKANGTVTFIFDGDEDSYKCVVSEGKASYTFDSSLLTQGNHNITVVYSGDGVYSNATSEMMTFTVSAKASKTNITLDKEDAVYGDSVKVTATVTDGATGNVTLLINGNEVETKYLNGSTCEFDLSLEVGQYVIAVRYNGDDDYASSVSENKNLNISKADINNITINVTPTEIITGDTVTVTATVTGGVAGNVSIYVDNKRKETKDFDGSNPVEFNLTDLSIGDRTVFIRYNGNEHYNSKDSESVTVNVKYPAPSLTISGLDSVVYNDEVTVTVKATISGSGHAEGTISFSLDGINWFNDTLDYGYLSGATASHKFTGLDKGNYTLLVKYIGGNCAPAEANKTFEVSRHDPELYVIGLNDTYYLDETLSITAVLNYYADKTNVSFKIDNGEWTNVTVKTGRVDGSYKAYADFSTGLSGLSVGTHNITVRYNGGSSYAVAEQTLEFTTVLRSPNMTVSEIPDSIALGDNLTVDVTLPAKANGTVTFIFDGDKDSYKCVVSEGKASYTFDSSLLTQGNHNITVVYSGDGVYSNATSEMMTFTVSAKASSTNITLNKEDTVYGDSVKVTVIVTDGATGNVTLLINGNEVETKDLNGSTCEFDLSLDAGQYVIAVRYNGDDDYASSVSENKNLNISKVDINNITINVTPTETTTDGTVTVTATVTGGVAGNVSVYVGKNLKETKYFDGSNPVEFNLTGLSVGENTIFVRYAGTKNYNSKDSESVTVNVRYSTTLKVISVSPSTITVGNNARITVDVDEEVPLLSPSGYIYYSFDNENWTSVALIIGGTIFSTGDELLEGNHTLYIKYNGDTRFAPSNNTVTLTVVRKSLNLTMDVSDIIIGEDLFVEATTVSGFTGNLTFDVNGTTQSVPVVNGKANATFSGLGVGDYLVIVKYDGDYNWAPASLNKTAGVKQGSIDNITASLNVTEIREIDSVKVTATLSEVVSGDVSVCVDGNVINTTSIPEGANSVEFILSNLAVGNHNITVVYNGNENLTSKESEKEVLTVKQGPVTPDMDIIIDGAIDIVIVDPTISGDTVTVTVRLAKNNKAVLGNVRFSLDNGTTWTEYVSLNNESYVDLIYPFVHYCGEANYTFTGLAEGTHTVLVEYEGSYDYRAVNGTKTFKTVKYDTSMSISIISIESLDLKSIISSIVSGNFDSLKEIPVGSNTAYALVIVNRNNTLISVPGTISYSFDNETWTDMNMSGIGTYYALIPLGDLKVGDYTLYVEYLENSQYNGCNGSENFSVIKRDANWDISVTPLNLDDVLNIPIDILNKTLNNDTLNLIKDILGGNTSGSLLNGTLAKDLLKVIGNLFNQTLQKDIIDIIINGILNRTLEYGDIPLVTVTDTSYPVLALLGAPAPTGTISFSLDGNKWYTEKVINLLNVPTALHVFALLGLDQLVLDAGNYTLYINYSGDDNYNPSYSNKTFEIKKVNPDISITMTPESIIPTEGALFTVTLDGNKLTQVKNPQGNVSFSIDGGEWITEDIISLLINSYSTHIFTNISEGNHTVTIKYSGDTNYNEVYANKTFEVIRPTPVLEIDVDAVTIGPNVDVRATLDDSKLLYEPTGNVSFKVDDGEWVTVDLTKIILDPHADYTFKGLSVGNHTVFVRYNGDVHFAPIEGNKTFEVTKIVPTLEIDVDDITYGKDAKVTVTLDDSYLLYEPSGNVSFKLGEDGEWITVDLTKRLLRDPSASYTFKDLAAGNYTVYIKYNGDDYFFPVSGSEEFTVNQAKPKFVIDAESVVYGNDVTVVATLPNNANGTVTFILSNGDSKTINITNGSAIAVFEGLGAKKYNVTAVYSGDNNYTNATVNGGFEVYKAYPNVNATIKNIYYKEDATVVVSVPEDAAGTISVSVDGRKTWYNGTIDNGTATITIPGLTGGNYSAYVLYNGDDNYLKAHCEVDFKVIRINPNINVSVDDIVYGNNATVDVTIATDATGNVTITLNNGMTQTVEISNGIASATFSGLGADYYNVKVSYPGDNNYYGLNHTTRFRVSQADPNISISIDDIDYRENATATVSLPEDATGNVTFFVDGKFYKVVPIVDGSASITVPGLEGGFHSVGAIYSGDQNYTSDMTGDYFVVNQIAPEMAIDVDDIDYRENATVTVSLPKDATRSVTFFVDGKFYKVVPVVDGSASITVPGLEGGFHSVGAIYSGDRNYKSAVIGDYFVVNQIAPEMAIDVDDIDYRENATVTLSLPADAKGFVNYFINGKYYKTVPVSKGDASIVIPNLEGGEYNISAFYFGDRNYKPGFVNDTFIVNPIVPECTVAVENITYHENETVTVTVPTDATGNVTITLDNGMTQTVDIVDGIASATFSGLGAGTYTGTYTYNGDRNYLPYTDNFEFVVYQDTPEVSASVENISYHDDAIVVISVPTDATGTVTVIVDDIPYEATIENGVAIVTIPGLQAGDHIAYVTYNGDQNYTNGTTEVSFNVAKIDPTIDVDVKSNMGVSVIVEGDDVIVTVTLPEDATGIVGFSIDGGKTWVYANVTDGIAKYVFKGLKAGDYELLVKYFGDNNYNPVETNTTFIVEELPAPENPLTMPNTGNPLLVLLIALAGLGLGSLKRKF